MICQPCGKVFIPKHPRGRFCSPRCRATAWQQRQAQVQRERDAKVRVLLGEALGLPFDAPTGCTPPQARGTEWAKAILASVS
jgi:hypothetical protein